MRDAGPAQCLSFPPGGPSERTPSQIDAYSTEFESQLTEETWVFWREVGRYIGRVRKYCLVMIWLAEECF